MGGRKLTVLRDKVEEQRQRLAELERFRERGGLPLPYTDLYQFPKPGSPLSATQLTEVARQLQSTIKKTERESERLRESLAEEESEILKQKTLILGLEQAVRDRARAFGCSGKTEECIVALKGNRVGKDIGRLRSDIIRLGAREKELMTCASTMESLAAGMETAAEYVEKNREELGKVQREIEELQESVREIKQYIDSTKETEGAIMRLEKATEKNKVAYANLVDYRYRLESRSRILEKDAGELANIRDFHASLHQENRCLQSSLASFTSEISLIAEATSVLSAQLAEVEEACEEKCTTPRFLSDKRAEIELAMESASQRQHLLQQELIQKIGDSKKLKQKLWESEKNTNELRVAHGLTQKEGQSVFRELTNLRERRRALVEEKASSLVSASASASQQQSELQSAQRRTECLKHDLQEASCLLAALRTELAATKSACESLPSAQSSLPSLQNSLQGVRHLVDISQKEIAAISDDLSALRQRARVQFCMWQVLRRTFSHKTWATVSPKEMSAAHPAAVKNLVGGQWVEPNVTVKVPDPLTGEPIMVVPETQIPETAAFLSSFKSVPKSGLHNPLKNVERYNLYGEICHKVAAALHQKDTFDFFVKLIQRNLAKSTGQASGEMKVVRTFFENFAGDNVRFLAKGFHVSGDHIGQQTQGYRWPYGPVAVIAPFNFPLEIPILQTMGALFMGNQVLLKPDQRTAVCTEQFLRLLHHCGMPTNDVSLLNGGHIAIDHLIKKNVFRMTQFTGSAKVAEYLSEVTKGKVKLEDAGFDWKVLGPDVSDLDYVAWQSDQDAYAFSGQKCSAQSLLLAHSNWVKAGFFDKIQKLAARRKLDDLTIGPVITWTTAKIQEHVDKVKALPGAKVLFGGKSLTGHTIPPVYGAFEPTAVFVPIDSLLANFKLCTTELFGPFQVVTEWSDLNSVLDILEKLDHHLTAAVVSRDTAFIQSVLANTVNGTTYAGIRARTTGAPQNHWFGPAGDPRAGGIGTPEAIRLVWSCHREIVLDQSPSPPAWRLPTAS